MAIVIQNPNINDGIDNNKRQTIGFKMPLETGTTHGNFESTTITIDAVKQNIISLLKTEKGERVLQPTLGLGLKKNLFENFTEELQLVLQEDITNAFRTWLPYVTLRSLNVEQSVNEPNRVNISVLFVVNNSPTNLYSVDVVV